MTANHMGDFEFRICPNNARKRVATQACLDKHLIRSVEFNKRVSTQTYLDKHIIRSAKFKKRV